MKTRRKAFTMIELVITLGIIGILATIAVPLWTSSSAKAKRAEARIGMDTLWAAQRAYGAEFHQYSPSFALIGFTLDGGSVVSATEVKGQYYDFQLSQPSGTKSWYAQATGEIDGDPWIDQLAIQEQPGVVMRSPQLVYDDLTNSYAPFTIAASSGSSSSSGSGSSGSSGSSSGSSGGSSNGNSGNNGNNGNSNGNGNGNSNGNSNGH